MNQTNPNNEQVLEATHILNQYLIENGTAEQRHAIFEIMNRVLQDIVEENQ